MPRKLRSFSDFSQPVSLPLAMAAMALLLTLTLLGPAMTTLGDAESGAGNVVRQLGYAVVFGLALIAMRPLKHPERLAVVPWFFWVALAWCWLSLAWALDPSVAIRRLVLTTIVIWSVFAAVKQLGIERTLLFVRIALVAILVVNYSVVLALPKFGLHNLDSEDPLLVGKWRGLMGDKNQAGLICAITIIFFSFDRRGLPYALLAGIILFSVIFLWFSASKTSLGLVFVAIAVSVGYIRLRPLMKVHRQMSPVRRNMILAGVAVAFVPLIHFGVQSDLFLNYIADSSGLTGRTEIWRAMMRYYLENPVFSAGYGSFWNIGNASPIFRYGEGWVQTVSEGHNGYLDLLITIGLPGLVLVIVATLIIPAYRLITTSHLSNATCALVVSLLFFCFSHNFTESSLFDRDTIGEVFLLLALAMLWTGEAKRRNAEVGAEGDKAGRPNSPDNPAVAMNRRARIRTGARPSGRENSRSGRRRG
ncbi:O-antigen ligase [Sphingomonas sp. NFR15]|uniref:O-antigen ligase family protein n=1 Tax=Sphingomonas sp. NFR15 TaxID=1566282 RepID=UPI00087E5C34|nr:O-antigen ligase [Sphingomonas sp. NFR15]SDA36967.1 O-antigen ligase [Sphingomonas sp. NFR15]